MTSLELETVFGGDAFAGTGRPSGVYPSPDGQLVAIAGSFGHYQWPGRSLASSRSFLHSVGVYSSKTLDLVAQIDAGMHEVNHIAWHPAQPILSISCGNYDGGYYFEGELILWNIGSGRRVSALDGSRQIEESSFDANDNVILIALPRTDEFKPWDEVPLYEITVPSDIWRRFKDRCIPAYDQLPEGETARRASDKKPPADHVAELQDIAAKIGRQYEPRSDTWDIKWLTDGRILCARNKTALEVWSESGERLFLQPHDLNGTQIVVSPDERHALVNLWERSYDKGWKDDAGLRRFDLSTFEPEDIDIEFPVCLSISRSGYVLVRDVTTGSHEQRGDPRHDAILSPDGRLSDELSLGAYGIFSDYIRVEGAEDLYFLRGREGDGSPKGTGLPWLAWKLLARAGLPRILPIWLHRLNPVSLDVTPVFPLEWDRKRGRLLYGGASLYVHDESGESVLISSEIYDAHKRNYELNRRQLPAGEKLWTITTPAAATSLSLFPRVGIVTLALRTGEIWLVRAADGEILWRATAGAIGEPTVVLSLSARGDRVACGSVDGRILIYRLSK